MGKEKKGIVDLACISCLVKSLAEVEVPSAAATKTSNSGKTVLCQRLKG